MECLVYHEQLNNKDVCIAATKKNKFLHLINYSKMLTLAADGASIKCKGIQCIEERKWVRLILQLTSEYRDICGHFVLVQFLNKFYRPI